MPVPLQNVTHVCFGLSYLLAFVLELARLRWPLQSVRGVGLFIGAAGLIAHSAYLAFNHPTPATPYGALLAVAWVLAVFYLYGAFHHTRYAWAVFVLPVVLGLVGLSFLFQTTSNTPSELAMPTWYVGDRFWGAVHGCFLLLAAVGVSVGFLASVMYLVQAQRLRAKLNPLGGMKMLSLERLESMNRRAVNLAFPMLTVGLLLGAVLLRHYHDLAENWFSVKVLGTIGLWLVCLLLFYCRYARHVSGRRLAWLTICAFVLMITVLGATHPFLQNGTANPVSTEGRS